MERCFDLNKDELASLLKECGAIQFGHFVLTSGAVSDYYIDIKKASTNPKVLKLIAKSIAPYAENYDIIAGMELGAVPLAVAVSIETNRPFVIIRKEKKEHGTGKLIEGPDVSQKKVMVVEDVTTTGGSVIKAIKYLRENGAIVDRVVTVVDRLGGAKEKLKDMNVEFIALLDVNDIFKKR
jgi:orotate phosphoribosyltransferase